MKNYQLYILGLIMACFTGAVSAQDYATALKTHAVYNHYYINPFLINPANTGFNSSKILFNYRNQWAGFDDSPKALTLAIEASPAKNMGLGGMIYTENFGVANRFMGQLNYAYQFRANDDMKFAFGISGAYIQYNLDNEALTDPQHESGDPRINDAVNGEKYFAADLGFYTEFMETFKIGISLPHLVQTSLDDSNTTTTEPKPEKPVSFVGMLGMMWKLPQYRVVIEPSIGLRKIADVPFGADINLLARMLEDRLFAGFTYSYNPSWHRISMLGGIKLDRFAFFYSYDQSYLDFQNFNNGSHEITLSLDLFKAKTTPAAAPMPEPMGK